MRARSAQATWHCLIRPHHRPVANSCLSFLIFVFGFEPVPVRHTHAHAQRQASQTDPTPSAHTKDLEIYAFDARSVTGHLMLVLSFNICSEGTPMLLYLTHVHLLRRVRSARVIPCPRSFVNSKFF